MDVPWMRRRLLDEIPQRTFQPARKTSAANQDQCDPLSHHQSNSPVEKKSKRAKV
ncbi:hypothetical protein cypCar_00004214 [Cyprinus carpio]|nr:hypothetical protein cypCar_00004214 [Cyprinus carpio]